MSGRDGGPAYPGKRCESVQPSDKFSPSTAEVTYGGLTVRQAYKLAALQGMRKWEENDVGLARKCSLIADAMLAEDAEFSKETPDA